jgi:transcriptional regulator with XRE-family HTH domain
MSIGKRIKDLRTKNNLTQSEFAELFHITDKAVSKWESEKGEPSLQVLIDISKYFEISLDEIVKGDEPVQSDHSSLLDRIVQKDSVVELEKAISNGLKIHNSDEFNKDIIDYVIKYKSIKTLKYLISKGIIGIPNSFFEDRTNNSKKINVEVSSNGTWKKTLHGMGISISSRNDALMDVVVYNKDVELITKLVSRGKEDSRYVSRNNNSRAPYLSKAVINRNKVLPLTNETLEIIGKSNDIELIKALTCFDSGLVVATMNRILQSVLEFGKESFKDKLLQLVIDHNQLALKHNEDARSKYKQTRKQQVLMSEFSFSDKIITSILDKKSYITQIAPFLTDRDITKETFEMICDKHGVKVFTSDRISYKSEKVASTLDGNDFVKYARDFYDKKKYVEYPIFEVFNHLDESPELVDDVILYMYVLFHQHIRFNRKLSVIMRREHNEPQTNKQKSYDLDIAEARMLFGTSYGEYILQKMETKENKMKLLELCANHLSEENLAKILPLYVGEDKKKVYIDLIKVQNAVALKKLIKVDKELDVEYSNQRQNQNRNRIMKNKHKTISSVLSELFTSKEVLREVVADLNQKDLDELLNKHCPDDDFEMIAFLIDNGAYLHSSYTTEQDDGWGYMETVHGMAQDKKKTAVMREMIRNFKK